LVVFVIKGVVWIGEKVLPFLMSLTSLLTAISVFIFIPMMIFKKTRKWAGGALAFSSLLFGLTLWIYSALVAYMLWGFIGLVIGLFMMGIGVVPVALLAALFSGEWTIIGSIIYMLILTFGARLFGLYVAEKAENKKSITYTGSFSENPMEEKYRIISEDAELNETKKDNNINFCSNCGAKFKEGTSFCTKCGKKIKL